MAELPFVLCPVLCVLCAVVSCVYILFCFVVLLGRCCMLSCVVCIVCCHVLLHVVVLLRACQVLLSRVVRVLCPASSFPTLNCKYPMFFFAERQLCTPARWSSLSKQHSLRSFARFPVLFWHPLWPAVIKCVLTVCSDSYG